MNDPVSMVVNTPPPKGRWLLGVGRLKSMLRLKPLVTCSSRLKARGRLLAEHPRSGCPLAGTIPLTENPLAGCLRSGYPLTGTAPPRNTRPAQPDATGMGYGIEVWHLTFHRIQWQTDDSHMLGAAKSLISRSRTVHSQRIRHRITSTISMD